MSVHTVNIISHKSDTRSRKTLINCISSGERRNHEYQSHLLSSMSQTIFEYAPQNISINVIDIDFDMVDFEIGINDIIYVDLDSSCQDKTEIKAKLEWVKKFRDGPPKIWAYEPWTPWYSYLEDDRPVPYIFICDPYCRKSWYQYITNLGIKSAFQTTIKLFDNCIRKGPKLINEEPWPLPSMTITVPKCVTIQSITHNKEQGEIKIIFS